jgi:hypothetical protein
MEKLFKINSIRYWEKQWSIGINLLKILSGDETFRNIDNLPEHLSFND